MSRKRMNILAILGILLFYIVCLLVSYEVSKHYVSNDFERNMENVIRGFEIQYANEDNRGEMTTIESIASEVSMAADETYPWKAVFVNKDGEIVAKTGSWIQVRTGLKFCYTYLDDYLTQEHWKKIYEYYGSIEFPDENLFSIPYTDSLRNKLSCSIDCLIEDEKIIPVNLHLAEIDNTENKLTLHLSENIIEAHFWYIWSDFETNDTIDKKYFLFGDKDTVYTRGTGIRLYFNGLDVLGENDEIYKQLEQSLTEENLQKNIRLDLYNTHAAWIGEAYWYMNWIQVNGEFYTVYLTAAYDEVYEVMKSPVFQSAVKIQSILFLLLGAFVLIMINFIYKKNQKLEKSRQMFTSAIAHELKTPVAIIQNQCECILENMDPGENRDYVESVFDEANHMNQMIGSFLRYNQLQSIMHIEKENVNLYEIVTEEIAKFEDLFESANLILITELMGSAMIHGNKELITLVIDNFLSNAYKYTNESCKVQVCIKRENKGYRFSVFNEGAVIEPDFQDKMWDVMSREDKARSRKMGSSGMGLSICRQILELHGFEYGCEISKEGVTFFFHT